MIIIIKHIAIEGPGLIEEFFENSNFEFKIIELEENSSLPSDFHSIEAAVILGGPMNVYEEGKFSFLRQEDEFIKEILSRQIPLLGICLGGQLLAKAGGAKVKKAASREIGWHSLDLTAQGMADPLFSSLNKEIEAFQWHEDEFEIPKNASLLTESEICPQAFRLGESAYGLQFHFEVTPNMIESWIKKYTPGEKEQKKLNTKQMLSDAYKKETSFRKQAYTLLLNFSRILEKNRLMCA